MWVWHCVHNYGSAESKSVADPGQVGVCKKVSQAAFNSPGARQGSMGQRARWSGCLRAGRTDPGRDVERPCP